jgi:ABC-type bacteriocin/lantibiotic exporter with double-glycine peptidase domain
VSLRRRWNAPEVVQSSAMDCGPAALLSLLRGHHIDASYSRLREACQTDVDGSSIDTLEDTARTLGLDVEQRMLPADHFLAHGAQNLPALLVVTLPGGGLHFVVVWRRIGSWLQVMDPARGRRWTSSRALLAEAYRHTMQVSMEDWQSWASSEEFLSVLRSRMEQSRLSSADAAELCREQTTLPNGLMLARLDAAVRLMQAIPGQKMTRAALLALMARPALIPAHYWTARPAADDEGTMHLRGLVLLHARGTTNAATELSPSMAAVLHDNTPHPLAMLLRAMRGDGWLSPLLLACALITAALGVVLEALLLRTLAGMGRWLTLSGQRMEIIAAAIVFALLFLLLEFPLVAGLLRAGRRLEVRLRMQLLEKIPRLEDRYFQSRLISDMAERAHSLQRLREFPLLAGMMLRGSAELLATVAAVWWLFPASRWWALGIAVVSVAVPFLAQGAMQERDLRFRNQGGALLRFFLDGLLGIAAIRAHGAERALRREQAGLLREWAISGLALHRAVVAAEVWQLGLCLPAAVLMVALHLQASPREELGAALLLVYWALQLPQLGLQLGQAAWQYPALRNITVRMLEPLSSPEASVAAEADMPLPRQFSVDLDGVTVLSAGHVVLNDLSLRLSPGEHVAIVGASGAGKSSLAGLLLGWFAPAAGELRIAGRKADPALFTALRRHTAWVDPAVQLWNAALLDNLRYGISTDNELKLMDTMERADLLTVLERMPRGMQSELGENGGLISGGEGQRVRLGRALLRPDVRLVVLDEAARGLEGGRRRTVLHLAREHWREATLLHISHDISDALEFPRVLVMQDGAIAEDGDPQQLAANEASLFARMLQEEDSLQQGYWASRRWRRFLMRDGRLREEQRLRRTDVPDALADQRAEGASW